MSVTLRAQPYVGESEIKLRVRVSKRVRVRVTIKVVQIRGSVQIIPEP